MDGWMHAWMGWMNGMGGWMDGYHSNMLIWCARNIS